MKIKNLWVSIYKNLKDLNLIFKSDLISLLVGRNGLGKSNIIEILALIFRDLDLLEKEEDFKTWAYDHFEYTINYECKKWELKIVCKEEVFVVEKREINSNKEFLAIPFSQFKRHKRAEYLPRYVIGYYSGENKRIREILRVYEEAAWSSLKNNKNDDDEGFRRMFFGENHHSQLVLLTLLLYQESTKSKVFRSKVNQLISNHTSFNRLDNIALKLKHPAWFRPNKAGHIDKSIILIESNILDKVESPYWNIRGKANKLISFFYDNNDVAPTYYQDEDGIERLELDSVNKTTIAQNVEEAFGSPINFLDAIESLYIIDSIQDIVLTVISDNRELKFKFTDLSEGEQQLITVIGLLLITGQDDSLFLFDEPDTHLNPAWQRKYVDLLHQFNLSDKNSHIIVATHSPLLVQAAENADVFLFERFNDNIKVTNHDFKVSNWRIDHVLMSQYFDLVSARPSYLDELIFKRKKIIQRGNLTDRDREELKKYENEIGYLPTGETIEELEAMLYINKMARKIENDQDR